MCRFAKTLVEYMCSDLMKSGVRRTTNPEQSSECEVHHVAARDLRLRGESGTPTEKVANRTGPTHWHERQGSPSNPAQLHAFHALSRARLARLRSPRLRLAEPLLKLALVRPRLRRALHPPNTLHLEKHPPDELPFSLPLLDDWRLHLVEGRGGRTKRTHTIAFFHRQ